MTAHFIDARRLRDATAMLLKSIPAAGYTLDVAAAGLRRAADAGVELAPKGMTDNSHLPRILSAKPDTFDQLGADQASAERLNLAAAAPWLDLDDARMRALHSAGFVAEALTLAAMSQARTAAGELGIIEEVLADFEIFLAEEFEDADAECQCGGRLLGSGCDACLDRGPRNRCRELVRRLYEFSKPSRPENASRDS